MPEHPFWVIGQGWTEAIDLCAGDVLVTQNGKHVIVTDIQHEYLDTPLAVYNFEVEGFHTYYVGKSSVLVHNNCGTQNMTPAGAGRSGAFNAAKKELGIPRTAQPTSIGPNIGKNGVRNPGRVYIFNDDIELFIRDDVAGHVYNNGDRLGPHFNTPSKNHFFY